MPSKNRNGKDIESQTNYTHRYTTYLLDLQKNCWAYKDVPRLPGRNAAEKNFYWNSWKELKKTRKEAQK